MFHSILLILHNHSSITLLLLLTIGYASLLSQLNIIGQCQLYPNCVTIK